MVLVMCTTMARCIWKEQDEVDGVFPFHSPRLISQLAIAKLASLHKGKNKRSRWYLSLPVLDLH
jgi:hypothetical protein